MVFDEVQVDLEAQGYEVIPFILPACGVNAPHRRERIWFIAYNDTYSNGHGFYKRDGDNEINPSEARIDAFCDIDKSGGDEFTTNPTGDRREREWKKIEIEKGLQSGSEPTGIMEGRPEGFCSNGITSDTTCAGFETEGEFTDSTAKGSRIGDMCGRWERFPTQSPLCGGNDGISTKLDGITFSKWRAESIKAGGNAIVPQVALEIFKAIAAFDELA